MPVINLATLQDILGGTEPINGSLTAYVYRGAFRAIRLDGENVIFPAPVTVEIVNGTPVDDLVLSVLPADCYWKILVWSDQKSPLRRNVVVPGDVGPYDFDELIDVDPSTALPDPGTSAADAYAALVESYAVRAETAALITEGNLDVTGDLNGTLPEVYLNTVGTAGTYKQVTTDTKGRVVSGTNTINNLQFDTTNAVAPTVTGNMAWNQADGTLDLKLNDGVTLQVGQENVVMAANHTGTAIPEGAAVHVSGAQGGRLKVALASASSESASANTLGVVTQSGGIPQGGSGYVTIQGLVRGLNLPTASYTEGAILWLGTTPGTWSTTRPTAPNHGVEIGYVVNPSNGTNGIIYVHVQNGYELTELHNVLITNPQPGDVLTFNGTVWVNAQP